MINGGGVSGVPNFAELSDRAIFQKPFILRAQPISLLAQNQNRAGRRPLPGKGTNLLGPALALVDLVGDQESRLRMSVHNRRPMGKLILADVVKPLEERKNRRLQIGGPRPHHAAMPENLRRRRLLGFHGPVTLAEKMEKLRVPKYLIA